jgi:carbamoyl-phosphate synthase large subunit
MRDAAIRIMRAVGVETGGANIQFAVDPGTGRMVVIEMNPRVSRSSALASKATGFPIAKIATKLAIGYSLDELRNDITRVTSACYEPSIDYCVVKMPRFAFEKFPDADETLTTSMKSVGEAMAIGRTFAEALQKCIRSLEIRRPGFGLYQDDRWIEGMRGGRSSGIAEPDQWIPATPSRGERRLPAIGGTTQAEAPGDWRESASREWPIPEAVLAEKIAIPCQGRLFYVRYALKLGWTVEQIHGLSHIDPWFLDQLADLVEFEKRLFAGQPERGDRGHVTGDMLALLPDAKARGYSDTQLANAWGLDAAVVRAATAPGPSYRLVDTCGAEFEAFTPYYYSTYEKPLARVAHHPEAVAELRRFQHSDGRCATGAAVASLAPEAASRYRVLDDEHVMVEFTDDELRVTDLPKVIVLGGGPNRIGQGIEFDYCCVHASAAARDLGYETVMINSNPETVSTDYDTSDLLFFEPLTHEDVLNVCERLNGGRFLPPAAGESGAQGRVHGVIVQFGGQTPLNLVHGLRHAGVPILGTSSENVHRAEDREQFSRALNELGLRQPPSGIAYSVDQAIEVADRIGYPVLVRPSYVLGGRGMQVCNHSDDLVHYIDLALHATDREATFGAQHPILVDKFLLNAIEIDVDAISDYGYPGRKDGRCDICGVMEHIEEAGIHSGDSSCVLPPYSLSPSVVDELKHQVKLLACRFQVCGLLNVQFAIQDGAIFIIEVNPRASRTIPFVSKATGVPWARVATQVMLGRPLGESLKEIGLRDVPSLKHVAVKVPVFPFVRFRGTDFVLGPEMRSTGEVMGIDATFPKAFAKGLLAAGIALPSSGRVLISVNDADKPRVVSIARDLVELGFDIFSTRGTHRILAVNGIPSTIVSKFGDPEHPFLLDLIERRDLDLLINTPIHTGSVSEEGRWRSASVQRGIPLITTLAGARAAVEAIRSIRAGTVGVRALQDYLGNGRPA